MPFTRAFVDIGKPKPVRYTIEVNNERKQSKLTAYSKQNLKKLVTKEHKRRLKKKHKTSKKQHSDLNWNFERLKRLISERLLARVKRPEQTMREAYKLFGVSKDGGVKKGKFAKALANMGLCLNPSEINELFTKFDVDNSGFLDFDELVDHCMPKDYSGKSWVSKRNDAISAARKIYVRPDAPNFPESTKDFRWTPDEIERILRQKLIARCKRPEEQFQTAFLLFGRPKHGITAVTMKNVCQKLGLSVTIDECKRMMVKWDDDHSGKLDFVEFCNGIMGPDYTKKTWNQLRGERMAKETTAKRLFVDVSVIEQHEQDIARFQKQQENDRVQKQNEQEHILQGQRKAILKKHIRHAKNKAKQKRGYAMPRRAKSASRVRGRRRRSSSQKPSDYLPAGIIYQHTSSLLPSSTMEEKMYSKQFNHHSNQANQANQAIRPATAGLRRRTLNPNSPSQRRLHEALGHSNSTRVLGRTRPRTAHGISSLLSSSRRSTKSGRLLASHDFGWK